MSGPLDGYRILDLTAMVAGPWCTMLLADQGAEVVKIEPAGGDHVRRGGNRHNDVAANFLNNNRNKRSVVLDLKSEAGRAAFLRLARHADAVVQNFRPGVVERLGIDYDAVTAVKPDIVYLSISGFGEEGPYAQKPAYDPIIQAASGLTTVQAGSDAERPRLVRTIVPDKVTALTAAQALTAALLHRERRGEGQHVRLSMLDSVLAFLWASDMGLQTFVGEPLRAQRPASFIDLIYQTADGYMSVAIMNDREWQAFCKVAERPDLAADPRFVTPALRDQNIDERLRLTQEVLKTRPTDDWVPLLEAERIPCAPVLTRNGVIAHEQVRAMGTVVEYEHPRAGRIRQARPAARFARSPAEIRHGAPDLGADT
ncbi:MAG TPA: CoA transferase, partial [Alphaproteobacteria bacterium]|nr:CoA transferase [Alphaproteobacteria bacterium]